MLDAHTSVVNAGHSIAEHNSNRVLDEDIVLQVGISHNQTASLKESEFRVRA